MEEAIKKADVLVEALPYIQAFRHKVVVIKYGGSAMVEAEKRRGFLEDIVFMYSVGMRPILVHGGGPFISEKMREGGVRPEFIDGIRVTDEATLTIVKDTLTRINGELVEHLQTLGAQAKSMCNGEVIDIQKYQPSPKIDLGYVGEISRINTEKLKAMMEKSVIPVIAPLGKGPESHLYNVNADRVAAEVAYALKAEKLVLLTDVHGILRDPLDQTSLISHLTIIEAHDLIDRKVITQGMIPKVQACFRSLEAPVHKSHIVDGRLSHSLLLEIFTDKGVGTEIVVDNER